MKLPINQVVLMAGLVFAMAAGMALGLTTGLFKGPEAASAQVPGVVADKSDTGDGTYEPGETFAYRLSFSQTSQTSETGQWHDVLPPQLDFVSLSASTAGLTCDGTTTITCSLAALVLPGTYSIDVNVMVNQSAACGPLVNQLVEGPPGFGFLADTVTSQIVNCQEQPLFRLCKEWVPQGAIAANRDFTFNVSDNSEFPTVQVTIPNVAEDGVPVCVLVSAAIGPIEVTETGIGGFDTPEWELEGFPEGDGPTAIFLLLNGVCPSDISPSLVERLVQVVPSGNNISCTVTFINEDNDTTTTTTPTIVVCPRCNTVTATIPPPTATQTPPPATATNTQPPSTQPPATATPTTGVATQAPGLTDAQRTATAVAAARTAAAQSTPIAPRTGGGTSGGAGGALNLALFAAGLIVLSSGLSLIAVRGRRS